MVPLREAIILWDGPNNKITIKRKGERETPAMKAMPSSGGAAFAMWQEASAGELYFRMMQKFTSLVRDEGIPVAVVHKAFMVIPEYVMTLPPCQEQDDLRESGVEVETPDKAWGSYPL